MGLVKGSSTIGAELLAARTTVGSGACSVLHPGMLLIPASQAAIVIHLIILVPFAAGMPMGRVRDKA
jgi:hypothetical protein